MIENPADVMKRRPEGPFAPIFYQRESEYLSGWHPCLKQLTRCDIVLPTGDTFTAFNSCRVFSDEECPRLTAQSPTGTEYELCGPPKHAEAQAVELLLKMYPAGAPNNPPMHSEGDGVTRAFLYGHDWVCKECQDALTAAGVRTIVITGEEA